MRSDLSKISIMMLIVHEALCRHRSTSTAPQALGITQPAVSQYLKQLRQIMDDQLFVRTKQELVPTELSVELLKQIETILDQCEEVVNYRSGAFDPENEDRKFTAAFLMFDTVKMYSVFAKDIMNKYPRIRVNLLHLTLDRALPAIDDRKLDLYIGEIPEGIPKYYAVELVNESSYMILCSDKSKLYKKDSITKTEFINTPSIKIPLDVGFSTMDAKLAKLGVLQQDLFCLPDVKTALDYVSKTDYIFMIDPKMVLEFMDEGNFKLLKPEFELPPNKLHQLWHIRHNNDSAHKWLRTKVREALTQ